MLIIARHILINGKLAQFLFPDPQRGGELLKTSHL